MLILTAGTCRLGGRFGDGPQSGGLATTGCSARMREYEFHFSNTLLSETSASSFTRRGRKRAGDSALKSTSASSPAVTGPGRFHHGFDRRRSRSSPLPLAANAIAERPESAPATITAVGASTTFKSPITATHPNAAPVRSTP